MNLLEIVLYDAFAITGRNITCWLSPRATPWVKRAFRGLPLGHPCPRRGAVTPTATEGQGLTVLSGLFQADSFEAATLIIHSSFSCLVFTTNYTNYTNFMDSCYLSYCVELHELVCEALRRLRMLAIVLAFSTRVACCPNSCNSFIILHIRGHEFV